MQELRRFSRILAGLVGYKIAPLELLQLSTDTYFFTKKLWFRLAYFAIYSHSPHV